MKWKRKSKRIEIERSKPVFTNPESLAEYIQDRFDGFYLIGIDGTSGVGKSCLSNQLSNIYHLYEIIDTDDEKYLNQNKGIDYTKYVKIENIKETVFKCQSNNIPVIINGICLLEIMERLPFLNSTLKCNSKIGCEKSEAAVGFVLFPPTKMRSTNETLLDLLYYDGHPKKS